MATRTTGSKGISPAGKIAILLIVFGIPVLFAFASWGLNRLFEIAPYAVGSIELIITYSEVSKILNPSFKH